MWIRVFRFKQEIYEHSDHMPKNLIFFHSFLKNGGRYLRTVP